VVAEAVTEAEATLRVASRDRAAAAVVKLWPEDEDWLCDCGAPSPCEHIAAAVIALRRAKESGKPLTVAAIERAVVTYRFHRRDGALALERGLRAGATESPLGVPLTAILAGRAPGPALNASKEDLAIDSLLGNAGFAALPSNLVAEILRRLDGSSHVTLDGTAIAVGRPLVPRRVVVVDEKEGIRARGESLPEVSEVFRNGAVIASAQLRAVRDPELSALEKEIVSRGRLFPPSDWAELASRWLPELQAKMPVQIETQRLPRAGGDSRPRLLLQTQASGDLLAVLPLLVYGDPPYARIDGGKLVLLGDATQVPDRSPAAEARLASDLHAELGFSLGKRIEFRGEAATKFAQRLRTWKGLISGNGLSFFGEKPPLVPTFQADENGIAITFRLPGGPGASMPRVLAAWREGLGRVSLDDGSGWAAIPREWLDRYGHPILELLEARRPDGSFPPYARPEIARLCTELDSPCPPAFARLRENLETYRGIPAHPLPADLTAQLRAYQRRGVDWLGFLRAQGLGALLADDMGLGKTLQAMCLFRDRTLVVAPTSVLPNWLRELARFRPALRTNAYHGPDRKLMPLADVTLTTYAILRLDGDALSETDWDTVVLDEAQNIKNPESQVAQAAFRLRGDFRVALTGTPIENRLEDLWSLFHFLNRGLLGGRSAFQERFGSGAPARAADLRAKIRPFLLRRVKAEVAPELPPRTESVRYCELDTDERAAYDMVKAAARKEVLESLQHNGSVLAALECLLRLRQASCHRGLLPGQVAEGSSKLRVLVDSLLEVVGEGHKALVFSQWTSLLDRIEPEIRREGMESLRIDGTTQDRAAVVDRFQAEQGPPILLMTLKTGGVGLNLTAADYVFLVDPWWNPAAEDQAADRAHRIGQTRPVFVTRLVARDTVEEKILALQDQKRAAAAAALDGADRAASITRDELIALLS
jgi:superfamily II DNA or RNA helicase